MCLELRKQSRKRYNTSKWRWKGVDIFRGELCGPYRLDYKYKQGRWMTADGNPKVVDSFGFHVMLTKEGAKNIPCTHVVRVEVKGFLRSGKYEGFGCETYRHMRIPKDAKILPVCHE